MVDSLAMEMDHRGLPRRLLPASAILAAILFSVYVLFDQFGTDSVSTIASDKRQNVFGISHGQRADLVTLPSGLQYRVLRRGSGAKPRRTDRVIVHYRGTLIDGTEFDSSYQRRQPADFQVSGVIKGWQEALQLMQVGAKWELVVPPELAYGSRGAPPSIGPGATLIFEVELLGIL